MNEREKHERVHELKLGIEYGDSSNISTVLEVQAEKKIALEARTAFKVDSSITVRNRARL